MAGNRGKGIVEEAAPILDTIPSPVTTFNIGGGDKHKLAKNYKKCVKDIRAAMDTTDVKFTFVDGGTTVPVTPGEDNTSRGTYVIKITDGQFSLSLVATKYQAWFRGIVTNNAGRYEIDKMPTKMMKGSISLHTDGQYTDLVPDGVGTLKVEYQRLFQAFFALATHGENENKEVKAAKKLALAVLIVMFFEGPRFPDVEKSVEDLLSSGKDDVVGKTNGKLINNWCKISDDFYNATGNDRRIVISHNTLEVVKTVQHGFRILCRSMWDKFLAGQGGTTGSSKGRASSSKSKK